MPTPTPPLARPSIDAVARAAGVSTATVSRVLNRSKPVAAETQRRVEAAITELGFSASPLGRALSTGRSGQVLLLVPNFANPFHAEIVRGAVAQARQHGLAVVPVDVEAMGSDSNDGEGVLLALARLPGDGVISLAPLIGRPNWRAAALARPWVNCSEYAPGDDAVPHVSIDHKQAATDAVQYLLNRGHRRIALVNGDERHHLFARQRRAGFEAALQRAGLQPEPALLLTASTMDYAGGMQAAATLLALPAPPTAVFAVADALAIGIIKGFKRGGRQVPDDVAVVGFDDVPIAEVYEPALTTIAQPMPALGAAAVDMLVERMAGGHPAHRVLPHRLVLRESA